MPAHPNVYKTGLIQIRARYTNEADGSKTENVLWYLGSFTSPLSLTQLGNIQTQFDSTWGGVWAPVGFSGVKYIGSIITDWSSSSGQQVDSTLTFAGTAGANSGALCPPQVAALMSLKIALRYRGGHGRVYFPYVSTGALTATQTVLSSVINSMIAAAVTHFNGMAAISTGNGGGFSPVVYKFRNNSALAATYPLTTYNFSATLATQRRRLRKAPHH